MKTQCQSACSTSQPPAIGPSAIPRPATAAQAPIAFARSSAGKTAVRIERVEGMMSAPPTPMSARLAMSCVRAAGQRGEDASRWRRR